jgi:hypothetical protein
VLEVEVFVFVVFVELLEASESLVAGVVLVELVVLPELVDAPESAVVVL